MSRYASDTYKLLVLDVAEIKLFIKLYESGKLPPDLIKEQIDLKIQAIIDIKFKMARGIVHKCEEHEVQKLFRKLVHIKDEALTAPRSKF